MSTDKYQPVEDAFRNGTVDAQDSETLKAFLLALSNQPIHNELVRHRDIIRGLTLNHILLQRHIDHLNTQNGRLQWMVVALTVASLFGTAAQVWYAHKSDLKLEPTASEPTQPKPASAAASALPPTSVLAGTASATTPAASKAPARAASK